MLNLEFHRGRCLPLGAMATPDGINFALLSRNAVGVSLVIYDRDSQPLTEIPLDRTRNRTGQHWHIVIQGLPPVFCYGWRVTGPPQPHPGDYFDSNLVLIDPTARAVSGGATWGKSDEPDLKHTTRRSVYLPRSFKWQGDQPPLTPLEDSIIYELHVRGFTCHRSSNVQHPGTFAGIIEKIPYLKWLGVTAVELLPIHEFDETDCVFRHPDSRKRHLNFWGYNSIAFAAPKAAFAATGAQFGQLTEFREMVRALHQAGIEVILDVVFNHTGEGDYRGRTYSYRGIDNRLYYMLTEEGRYHNFSGCGNTVSCNHPLVRDLIMNNLRFWVADMHIDGLRFDLASVLGRGHDGKILGDPPVIESIATDAVLADTKLIAEPWDAAGMYQVGHFPYGQRWSEWNGMYRDHVRRFWRGEPGMTGALATRLCGSSDLYEKSGRRPHHSINFITCHDGFTLNDLVSYNQKHNRDNGEDNRDGMNENFSWNCGHEGPTSDGHVNMLRQRQARNLFATLMLSQGVPMILGGDEFLRTQRGNNNAWCQDNEISWVNWDLAEENKAFLRFVREVIALRKAHPALRRRAFFRPGDIVWHGVQPNRPDFSTTSRALAAVIDGRRTGDKVDRDFYMAFNSWQGPLSFVIPPSPQEKRWRRVIDTGLTPPRDFTPEGEGEVINVWSEYRMASHSLLVLVSEA